MLGEGRGHDGEAVYQTMGIQIVLFLSHYFSVAFQSNVTWKRWFSVQ